MFGQVATMNVNNIQVSYVDDRLFNCKDMVLGDVGDLIKSEGNGAMRTVAKKVLDKFWRYYKTADASTNTEEKVIDGLKNALFEV